MKNYVARFKSLPVSTRRLLSVGMLLALVVALPLFIWAILNNKFLIIKKAASGEPGTTVPLAINETFTGPGALDASKWNWSGTSGSSVTIFNNSLKIAVPAGHDSVGGNDAVAQALVNYQIPTMVGNFSVSVDLGIPETTNGYEELKFTPNGAATIRRAKVGTTETIEGWTSVDNSNWFKNASINLPAGTGPVKVLMTRTGDMINAYYDLGSGYQQLYYSSVGGFGSNYTLPRLNVENMGVDFPATTGFFDNYIANGDMLPFSLATSSPGPNPPSGAECGFCGGIAGIGCQAGLTCQMPFRSNIPDQGGICVKTNGTSTCATAIPTGTPQPTPVGNTINWNTNYVNLSATNFYINIQGKGVYLSNSNLNLTSNPANPNYTTLEATWQERGVEMRLFMYFARDPGSNTWSVTEMRTYNGNSPGNWIYYPGLQGGTSGTALNIPNANFHSIEGTGLIHMENMVLRPAFSTQTGGTQTYTFNVKLVGVTDGSADGAQVRIRFKNLTAPGGVFDYTTSPVSLTYIGNGTYQAALLFGTVVPPLPGGEYTIFIKGEKHLSRKFCQATGQTFICTGDGHIQINGSGDNQTFDFTGLALEPGDVYPQDGAVNSADFNKVVTLLAKPCSALTDQEKLIGDLDYNGCVTVKDVFLIRQTLQARYDEN